MLAGWQKPVDFSRREEYSVRASGRHLERLPETTKGHARRRDQLVLGETARNQ